jgi:hypothetical protein
MPIREYKIRPRVLKRLLVSMAAGAVLAGTGIGWATDARADAGTDYAAGNAARICATLDAYPTLNGIMGVGQAIVNEGYMSFYDAGRAIAVSIAVVCPQHQPLMERFIALYAPTQQRFVA